MTLFLYFTEIDLLSICVSVHHASQVGLSTMENMETTLEEP